MKSITILKQLILILLVFVFSATISFGQICGDVNEDGSVSIVDALLCAQEYVGLNPPALTAPLEFCDVDCNGSITIVDALRLAQVYVGVISQSDLNCCGGETPTPQPASGGILLEAELYSRASDNDAANQGLRGTRTDGVDFEDNWQGALNTGWVSGGEWLEWDVNVSSSGTYNVWVRAGHDDSGTLTGQILVNGAVIGNVNVPNTDPYNVAHPPGHWQSWRNFNVGSANLNSGNNTVRLLHTGYSGSFNLDYVYLMGGSGEPPMPTSVPRPGGYQAPVNSYGRLQVIGTNLCNSSGSPIQLRGISTHDLRWHWISAKHTIQNLAYTRGVDLIRLVIYSDAGNYGWAASGHQDVLRERLNAYLDDVIEAGIYAIVDWHILNDGDPMSYVSQAEDFFDEYSRRNGGDSNIIWEICNEPNGPDWNRIKEYANRVIPVIRSNSNGVILVGTPSFSSQPDVASQSPLTGYSNIMYTHHFYTGTHGTDYRNRAETARSNGCAVFISEWGATNANASNPNVGQAQDWANWMANPDNYGGALSWCNWSFCNKAEGSSILSTPAIFAGPWSSSDFTTIGKWVMSQM